MILVVSRFRVANGMEEEVAEAFAGRPRMVEHTPGFLGMEVYRPVDDPAAFHLVTRWTDEASYRDWHRSDARRESQSSIPKGLKLDPAHTRIEVLERLDGRSADGATERLVLDSAGIVAELASTCARSLILLAVDASGRITGMSHSAARALGIRGDAEPPPSLWDHLTEPDAATVRAFLGGEGGGAGRRATLLLNLVDSRHAPLSAMCVVERRPGGCGALAGEVQRSDTEEILLSTTNEMAVAQRELAKSNRMLERKYVSASARAAMDEQTGLFNRRHFDAELARQLARVRADRPLGLIMADIDHFKRVNDTLGHTAGDAVLQAMGACLLAGVRPSDVVARYGGEEFAVLLPDARLPEVVRVAERLRTTVGAMRMDGVDVTVTASFGVGCAFAPCDPVEFLNRVDAALYAAKADGRDRVRVAEEGAG